MEKNGSALKKVLLIFGAMGMLFAFIWFIGWLRSTPSQYKREDTEFYGLPIASSTHEKLLISDQISIDDRSSYAENEILALYQYTRYSYDDGMLIAEADYDEDGDQLQWTMWEYDSAGNMRTEQTGNGADVIRTYSHFYEYDSSGWVVHEEIYRDEDLMEDNYFRHTDIGCAGVSYSYPDNQADGGISSSSPSRTEFLEDQQSHTLCVFEFNSWDLNEPCEAWKMQWMQQDNQIVCRVQNYKDNEYGFWIRQSNDSVYQNHWYQTRGWADTEQVNLYEYNPETGVGNPTLQLNYEWQIEQYDFCLTPSFYRAQYDGDHLLWQMLYSDGSLTHYSAYQYDTDGQLEIAVEYDTEKEKPYALLHRYEYPEDDIMEEYVYEIQGQEFSHSFGDGENVLLTFSKTGILIGIEMIDAVGTVLEKYEFTESGNEVGKLKNIHIGTDVITGEDAVLEKLEEEAGVE